MTDADGHVDSLLAQARALIAVKRYDEAVEHAREAASLAPDDARPFCEWSQALHGARRYREASQIAGEAIRLAPNRAVGYRLQSASLASLARESPRRDQPRLGEEAVAAARQAITLAPWDVDGLLQLAQSLPLTGEVKEADAVVREAIRLAPNSASTWVAASLVAFRAKNWAAAIDASHKALAIDPENYAALNNLGVALRASGRGREGAAVLAQAARLEPDRPTARTNLSRAGLNVVRLAILLPLIPIGILAHVGLTIYILFAIASNIIISRNPRLALRLERFGAPVALFLGGAPRVHRRVPAVLRREPAALTRPTARRRLHGRR